MPELPEVETVRKTLQKLVLHKTIEKVTVHWPKMIQFPIEVEQFCDALKGETFVDIGRRGKFLILYTNQFALVSHLRMEGRYGLFDKEEPFDKHTHVIFHFTDDSELRYRDVRKFGTMHLFKKGEEFQRPPLTSLGPEPFSEDFTAAYLGEKLKKTNRKVKSALLDQNLFVGLGNIYVDEALFRAAIHPERAAHSLSELEISLLHQEIVRTLSEAVKKGGSTIRSYVNSQGEIGMFQLELFAYGRQGEPCKRCGTPMEKITVGGRGTHYCPTCQKL
ncbi:DNA-formamidopyrimidine glycosylase [Bacillus sp. BRMEA1]|uniref:DNA-formamidopyrimidine glycosylase n=1 Tax=Neobacillus endophyticus TaxID=2738405 RepID=UPI001565147F|nr:DNA-formamidopyrimidine glycosylase [Neobacillus endophyticus]NRD76081.1 DNA-formamidopyrimidine glycosylase [Neobacillus endophyticus]